jgi:hypothetical protein
MARIHIATFASVALIILGMSFYFGSSARGAGNDCVAVLVGPCTGAQSCGCQTAEWITPNTTKICPVTDGGTIKSCVDDTASGPLICFTRGNCQLTNTRCVSDPTKYQTVVGNGSAQYQGYNKIPKVGEGPCEN